MIIVKCENITKSFPIRRGYLRQQVGAVRAVSDVSLEIAKGDIYGLVGESGSGKTTLGKIMLGVMKPDCGEVEVTTDKLQAVFQDPHNSLDPKMSLRDILAEGLILKGRASGLQSRLEDAMALIRLPKAALNKYPHQFSGGERQRIAIARAVVTEPDFIVYDEPVSSLDVTIQLQILRLIKDIHKKFDITGLFISHDLRVIKFMCNRVAVMKEGRIIEKGDTSSVYSNPAHSYTKLLLSSIPSLKSLAAAA